MSLKTKKNPNKQKTKTKQTNEKNIAREIVQFTKIYEFISLKKKEKVISLLDTQCATVHLYLKITVYIRLWEPPDTKIKNNKK